ncbi:Lipase-like domain-containing protein [Desulfonema limicola]|uniref:Lipase-like domain-containing protein n=1 Tax=Desulfonema limicola TaxID=45656 RepID=A0A975B9L4_9BACT|nr:type VI secretion system protein IglI family protein [Desulfonema limicola]QTA81216.1 Lipase-like domain-containing protein [Desulfonema limicola]
MNIEILLGQSLEITETPGLETFDPRFTDITTLVQEGNYEQAAVQSQEILEQGIYDIRIIGYFLYGVFLEQGIVSLAPVFETISGILTDNWEAVGPVKNLDKHTANTIKWFAAQLNKKLEYEENKKEAVWDTWSQETDSDQVQEAMDALEKLQRSLGMTLEDKAGPLVDNMMKINAWLRSFYQIVYREPEPEPEPEEEPEEYEEYIEEEPETPGVKTQAASLSGTAPAGSIPAEGSYHLQVLLQKLDAFDRLISAEKFHLAALAADDINTIIANFDPKIYFPKIFARFSLLFARHISELIAHEQHKGSVEWMALQELYKVDLESFVGFDAEIQFSSSQFAGSEYQGQNEEYYEEQHGQDTDY